MYWLEIASDIFALRWTIVVVIGALYLIPLLRLLTLPLSSNHPIISFFNRRLGQYEHAVAWFRDTIGVTYLSLAGVWHFFIGVDIGQWDHIVLGIVCFGFIILSMASYYWKRNGRRQFLDFMCSNPTINPKEFIDNYLCMAGGIRHILPKKVQNTIDPAHLDFRSPRRKRIGIVRLLSGMWKTITLARLTSLALNWKGKEYFMEAASTVMLIWSSLVAQVAYAEIVIEGIENLADLDGFHIYLFNHLSFLDFMIAPLALGVKLKFVQSKVNTLPRFLLAKSHFLNNPILYGVIGLGRFCKEAGMVFVERRGRESAAKAAAKAAAEKLVRDGIDFAIYPQGTRAPGRAGPSGERIDGGYYAVGTLARLKRDGDHLKKGAAHIATEAALLLKEKGIEANINLIPVAFKGTGIVAPKGSMRIKPNVTIRMRVGEPIIVKKADVQGFESSESSAYTDFVHHLHHRIDMAFKSNLMVHGELERRFFEDMRTLVEQLDIEEMSIAMKQWRGDDYLVHAILDCIYTCKPKYWRPQLGRLIYLIKNDAARDELLAFKGEVAEKIYSK